MNSPNHPRPAGDVAPDPIVPPPTEGERDDEATLEHEGQWVYENTPKWPGGGKKGENIQP